MGLALKQFAALVRLTLREAVRQPIGLLLVITSVLVIGLFPFLITHTLEDTDKLVRDSALAVHLVLGLFLGGYVACVSLGREIRQGTASSILSKPVGRSLFFLAKFCGIALFMILFSAAAALATLISTRVAHSADENWQTDWWAAAPLLAAPVAAVAVALVMNFRFKKSFVNTAFYGLMFALTVALLVSGAFDPDGRLGLGWSSLPLDTLSASFLITLAVVILSALAASLATRLDTVPTLTLCALLLLIGLISDYLFGRLALAGNLPARGLYYVLPDWQHFWAVDLLGQAGRISPTYLRDTSLYAALYLSGVLCLGTAAFRSMEIK